MCDGATWKVTLPPLEATGFEGKTMTVSSSDGSSAELQDVVVGDVFLCSGQVRKNSPRFPSAALTPPSAA